MSLHHYQSFTFQWTNFSKVSANLWKTETMSISDLSFIGFVLTLIGWMLVSRMTCFIKKSNNMLCTQWNVRNSYPSLVMSQKVIKQKEAMHQPHAYLRKLYTYKVSHTSIYWHPTQKHTSFQRSNTDIPPSSKISVNVLLLKWRWVRVTL